MEEELQQLKRQVQELIEWKNQKIQQQIAFPLDDVSRNILLGGAIAFDSIGSTDTTDTIALSGNAENIDVPAAYDGTVVLLINGVRYEIPYIASS